MAVPIDPAAADLAALEDPAPPAVPVPAAVDPVLPAPPAPNVQPAGAVAGQYEQFNEVFCAFFLFQSFSLIACFSLVSFCFFSREGLLMFTTCWLLFNIRSCVGHIFGLPCVGSS